MKKDLKYILAKNGGKLYRDYLEPSAFKGTPTLVDKIGSKITDPIFYKASYAIVGAGGYRSGANPALGSLAYTAVHTLLKFFFWLIVISSGLGLKLLQGLWKILKVVAPFIGKGLLEIAKFLFPLVGKLLFGILKLFGLGVIKLVSGIFSLIF